MRRPNIASAGVDLAFAALALIAGALGASLMAAGTIFAGAALLWAWTRRGPLSRMDMRQRATNSALALAMLAAVLGVAYWIGLGLGGHT
ncbi:MAG: hypothetical protein AB7O98_13825 [Hyphomonadaceae bacterium]